MVFILLVAPHFVLPVVAVEAAAFLCVTALGGRRRWRTFLWLTPLVWLLTFPLVAVAELSLSRQTHLIGSLLIVVGCQILRLLACTSALREEERSNLPPIGQLLGILFVGIGCGAGYAWLLTFRHDRCLGRGPSPTDDQSDRRRSIGLGAHRRARHGVGGGVRFGFGL